MTGRFCPIGCFRQKASQKRLFAAPGHVVDEGAVDVGAAHADQVKEFLVIGDKVLCIHEVFVDDQGMAGVAEHHQAT